MRLLGDGHQRSKYSPRGLGRKKDAKSQSPLLPEKLLTTIPHLLTYQAFSDAKENPKKKRRLPAAPPQVQHYTTQQMVQTLADAGYAVGKLEGTG